MDDEKYEKYGKCIGWVVYCTILILNILIGVYGVVYINSGRYVVLCVTYSVISVFLMVLVPGVLFVCIPWMSSRGNFEEEYYMN